MALGNMLAGIGGFTEGWKAMDELIKSHQSMLARAEQIEGYTKAKELTDAQAKVKEAMALDPTFGVDPDAPKGTTGSSLPPGAAPPEMGSGKSLSTSDVYKLVTDVGFTGEAANIMTAVIRAESSNDPGAIGDKNIGGSYGLTQINKKAHGDKALEALNNPRRAVELAWDISNHGTNFTPWTMFKNGVYKRYMGAPPDLEGQRARAAPALAAAPTAPAAPAAPATAPSALGGGDFPGASSAVTAPPATARVVAEAPIPPPPAALPPLQKGLTPEQYRQQYGQGYPPGALEGRRPPPRGGSGGGTPMMPGPGAGGNPYNTPLPPAQEAAFRAWVKNNKVKFNPDQDMADYNMRGFWAAQQQGDPRAQTQYNPDANEVHYPDVWKTPIHKTFSNESQYAPPGAPRWEGGRLISQDGTVLVDENAGNALGR